MKNRDIIQVIISGTDICIQDNFIKKITLKNNGEGDYCLPDYDSLIIDVQSLDIEFYEICKNSCPPYALELNSIIKDATAVICMDSFAEVKFTLSQEALPNCLYIDFHQYQVTPNECLIDITKGVNEKLISKVTEKTQFLFCARYDEPSIFHLLPKETMTSICQSLVKAEFQKNPYSCAFFHFRKNSNPSGVLETKTSPGLNQRL